MSSSKNSNDPKSSGFDGGLGDKGMSFDQTGKASLDKRQLTNSDEQWTEPYMEYREGAAQSATPPGAKSVSGAASPARGQADAARGISVHDGFPNPATDISLQNLDLNTLLIQNSASTFFMLIQGSNWARQGIFADDIAIIDRALAPKPNDPVVWIRDDIFTISPRHKLPEGAEVWGTVTAIIHRYRGKL